MRTVSKKLSFLLVFALVVSMLLPGTVAFAANAKLNNAAEEKEGQQSPTMVVEHLVDAMNSQNYHAQINLWIRHEQDILRQFLFNDSNAKAKGLGLHGIKNAKLLGLKQLPIEVGNRYGADATDYISEYGDAYLFYAAFDLKVRKESHYFMNGANYFLVLLVPEGDQWKVALMPQAPVYELNQDGFGFADEAEKKAIKRQQHLEKTGEVINENEIVIEDLSASPGQLREEKGGKDTVRIFKEDAKLAQSDVSIAATSEHTKPSTIRVYLTNSTNYKFYGRSAPFSKSIDFYYYTKNVLPKEWGYDSTYKDKSLQAGAIAVKMYGWYRVYHPKWPSLNADVQDNTKDQTFIVTSEKSRTTSAINAVGGIGVDIKSGSSYVLFEVHYKDGYYSDGGRYGGWMWQHGTRYWADKEKGYTFMCHWYWDKSGTEPIHFFYY
ncbi:MAG: hypothetical protein IBX64_13145 [Actinobacteria bacterium]|nr:hypothetical protein [Actinomycetota bacterium]